jgi:hypothetical protein
MDININRCFKDFVLKALDDDEGLNSASYEALELLAETLELSEYLNSLPVKATGGRFYLPEGYSLSEGNSEVEDEVEELINILRKI